MHGTCARRLPVVVLLSSAALWSRYDHGSVLYSKSMSTHRVESAWAPLLLALLAVSSSCSLVASAIESDLGDPGGGDGDGTGIDAGVGDVECGDWGAVANDLDPCSFVEPTGSLDLRNGPWKYDTATGTLTAPDGTASTPTSQLRSQEGGDDIRVLSVTDLRVRQTASLWAIGPYPLLVLSFDGIRVEGQFTVSSSKEGRGAGADSALCGQQTGEPGASSNTLSGVVGSGGGGGSLVVEGGDGGDADDGDGAQGGRGGGGGSLPSTLRGGCQGGSGGEGGGFGAAVAGGAPGSGGGGLLLFSKNYVDISGQLAASGQGGLETTKGGAGGGGGGSGGLIIISTDTLSIRDGGVVAANGGGGAQGSELLPGQAGQDGVLSVQEAQGGDDPNVSGVGVGGDGGALDQKQGHNGKKGTRADSGGGGGGGAGEILVRVSSLQRAPGAVVSPQLTTP